MTISATTQGLRPGVCTSSNRPATPFEGQMIYETDTDLTYVYGGSAWQQVAGGTAVGNSGLVYVTSATVGNAVTTVTVSNAFSTTYDNYRITFAGSTPTATDSFRLMISSGATADHYGSMPYDLFNGASSGTLRVNNGASIYAALNEGGNKTSQFSCDVLSPFLAQPTVIIGQSHGRGYYCHFGGTRTASTSYTSFTITADGAGTFTGGTINVYGYRK